MDARLSRAVAAAVALAIGLSAASSRALELRAGGELGPIDRARLEELIRLELRDRAEGAVVEITVSAGVARVAVELGDGATRREASISLDGDERERALALFAGELAREPAEPPAPPPDPPAVRPSPRDAPKEPSERVSNPVSAPTPRAASTGRVSPSVDLGARWFPRDGALLPTLSAGASLAVARSLDVTLHGQYGYASRGDALGRVHVHAVGLASCALVGSPRGPGATLAAGPCVGGGLLVGVGAGAGASSAAHGYGTAHLRGEARSGVLGPARLLAAVEAGAMTGGIDLRADDRPVLATRGLWLSLALGARLP